MTRKKDISILIADDMEMNRQILLDLIKPMGYRLFEAKNGKMALDLILKHKPDLILLDLNMPEMDGFEVLRVIKANPDTKIIPVVVITGLSDEQNHLKALEAGADDFLTKPFNINFLKARMKSLLTGKMLYDQNIFYQEKLKKSNVELLRKIVRTQEVTIIALAKLAEFRDPETGEHLERMREYVKVLSLQLRELPEYREHITDQYIENIYKSTPLHDIGKVGIPDHILLKPGKLTPEEFEIMKLHTVIGGNSLGMAIKTAGIESSFLDMGTKIAHHHHERWDGTGYPNMLKGPSIPLCARIVALADVYDALTTKRVYKPAFSHEKSKQIILNGAGTSFDPDIVEAFKKREKDFLTIRKEFEDTIKDQKLQAVDLKKF